MQIPSSIARRAQPMLGTLVDAGADRADALPAAFEAVAQVQRLMSRFDAASDIGRFNALACCGDIEVHPWTAEVLHAARCLAEASGGRFDVSLGSGPQGWACEGLHLVKLQPGTVLDLGGVAKGYALDRAVDAIVAAGASTGWVNAGGDVRVFGAIELPIALRDESAGGVRHFGQLSDGALATSCFEGTARSALHGQQANSAAHVSVAAPLGLWADALTKLVALEGRADLSLLQHFGARAWLH